MYKLTGTSGIDQVNAGYSYANAVFDWCVMYPNPYIVITPKGYTKHYYAGAERIATVLGGGGFEDQKYPIVSLNKQHENDIINKFNLNYKSYDPFNHEKRLSDPLPTATTDGNTLHELDYQCNSIVLEHLDILSKQDMLLGIITKNCAEHSDEKEIFYFHGDHLGSASWITDASSKPIQYIYYAPYGELIDNQRVINYDERYKFTGKERDAESGYDYFGARYYASPFSFWLSVDPLADKYPNISPYAYCTWNPVKFVDPDGNFPLSILLGMICDYGSQVYNNYNSGKSGYDAWVGDINYIQVGLSAINPTGKLAIVKTLVIEAIKNLTKGSNINNGIIINDDIEEVIKKTIINTVTNYSIGKFVDSGSDNAVKEINKKSDAANKQLKTAIRQAERHPNSQNKANQLENAKINAKQMRAELVRAKMINSTIGKDPEKSKIIINNGVDVIKNNKNEK